MAFIQNYNAQDDKTEIVGSTTGDNVAPIISSGIAPDAADVQLTSKPTTSQQAENSFGALSNYLKNAQSNQVNNTAPVTSGIPSQISEPDVNGISPIGGNATAQKPAATSPPVINTQPIGPITPIPAPIINPQPIGPIIPIIPNPVTPIMPQPIGPIIPIMPRQTNEQKYGKATVRKAPSGTTVVNYGKSRAPQFNTIKNYLGKPR